MKIKFTVIKSTSFIFILCLILEFILYRNISLLQTTNVTFSAASLFLIVSLFWAVLYSGAFDFFHYSMKKVTAKMRAEEEPENLGESSLSKSVGHGYKFPLKIGINLLVISLAALTLYYFT